MTDTIPATVKMHTALPWEAQPLETEGDVGVSIVGSDLGGLVCAALPWPTEIDSEDYSRVEANAAFIVRACNSHYQLVSALREAIEELWDREHSSMDRIQFERANASLFTALSQAGGE